MAELPEGTELGTGMSPLSPSTAARSWEIAALEEGGVAYCRKKEGKV